MISLDSATHIKFQVEPFVNSNRAYRILLRGVGGRVAIPINNPDKYIPLCRVYDSPRLGTLSADGAYVIWDDLPGSPILITDRRYFRPVEISDLTATH